MGGFAGFDYNVLQFILEAKQVPRSLWPLVLEQMDALTQVAVKHWNAKST